MKLNSIKNLFEYKDRSFEQVDRILLSNIDKLQGLGLPDVCVIVKKLPKSILHRDQEQVSSFHLVQGLCPQSQAEVLAYIQTLLQNQETSEQRNVFSLNYMISKISYYIYDIFSKTILVCQFELLPDGQSQIKIYGVQDKKQYILLTKSHWDGAYISNILRALDPEMKIPNVGRFFNNIYLQNNRKITDVVITLLRQISLSTINFSNMAVIQQNNQFPEFDDLIYYLNWPIYIMFKHLSRTSQIIILIKMLDEIEDNLIFYLIKSILYYKMKNYEKALEYLTSPLVSKWQLSLIKYMISRVLIKLKRFEESFLLLKDLLVKAYENQIVWITLAKIFRKLNNYQITFCLLNQASKLNHNLAIKLERNEINLQNYKLISSCDNINDVNDLDEIFQVVYPMQANQLESFSQLSSHPILEKILLKQRKLDKKDLKNKKKILQRYMQNPQIQVNDQTIKAIQDYEQKDKNESQLIKTEVIKLINQLGCAKVQKYLLLYFYHPMLSLSKENSQEQHISQFQIKMKKDIKKNQVEYENKSLMNLTLDSEPDEKDYPDFWKEKLNKTFDFSTTQLTNSETPQSKLNLSPIKITQKVKPKEQISKTYYVIQENAYESVESERNTVLKGMIKSLHLHTNSKTPIGPQSQDETQFKIQIYGWQDYFNLNMEQKKVFDEQLRRKKEIINPALSKIFQNIFSVSNELDQLFHPQTQKIYKNQFQSQNNSQMHSPKVKVSQQKIFKSQLLKSLKTKQHLPKPIEIRDFYVTHATCFDQIDEKNYDHIIKIESIFLYKVVRIALQMNKKELANQVLHKINQNTISVQISQLLFELNFDNHIQLILTIQKILLDFEDCGINQVTFIPIWIENYIIKLTRQMGANYVLGLLTNLDNDQIFKMLKQIILRAEDLL